MNWIEILRAVISGMNFLPGEQKMQLLSNFEVLCLAKPQNWQDLIRDYFQLTTKICSPVPTLTQMLEEARKDFELSLIVDEVGKEIFREIAVHPQ